MKKSGRRENDFTAPWLDREDMRQVLLRDGVDCLEGLGGRGLDPLAIDEDGLHGGWRGAGGG